MDNLFQRIVQTGNFCLLNSLLLLLGRFSIALTFWLSGQTKISGFQLNPVTWTFEFGWPHIKPATYYLFKNEYALPIIPSDIAAVMASISEHLFPILIIFGLFTRPAALALTGMTLVIQLFVYPEAYPTHTLWLTVLLMLVMFGGGRFSIDRFFTNK